MELNSLKIKLEAKDIATARNITEAKSRPFADLVRAVERMEKSRKVGGSFKFYKQTNGSVYLELQFESE